MTISRQGYVLFQVITKNALEFPKIRQVCFLNKSHNQPNYMSLNLVIAIPCEYENKNRRLCSLQIKFQPKLSKCFWIRTFVLARMRAFFNFFIYNNFRMNYVTPRILRLFYGLIGFTTLRQERPVLIIPAFCFVPISFSIIRCYNLLCRPLLCYVMNRINLMFYYYSPSSENNEYILTTYISYQIFVSPSLIKCKHAQH